MSAPENNEFWKMRSKHGRNKIFETADIMLQACYEYFEYQSQQVWNKIDFKGRDIEEVKIPTSSPFTLTGLCIFLDVNTQYFGDFKAGLDIAKPEDKDFSLVIKHIEEVIFTQKFEGAAVGVYNSNIIARDLGLKERTENTNTHIDLTPLTDEERAEASKRHDEEY